MPGGIDSPPDGGGGGTGPKGSTPLIRTFPSGATRDSNQFKLEFARFLSPEVLNEFALYMHKHRVQSDGSLRAPDNWKRGLPRQAYMDSLMRHLMDLWALHEGISVTRPEDSSMPDLKETLCSIMFNSMGYLYEVLRGR